MVKVKIESVYKEALKVSSVIFLIGIIEFLILTAFFSLRTDVLLGVLYGTAFSSLNFFYLAHCVKKSAEKDEKNAKNYMSATYSSRVFLTAVMIFIAAKVDRINIWAAVIPLVFTRIAAIIVPFINKHTKKGSDID